MKSLLIQSNFILYFIYLSSFSFKQPSNMATFSWTEFKNWVVSSIYEHRRRILLEIINFFGLFSYLLLLLLFLLTIVNSRTFLEADRHRRQNPTRRHNTNWHFVFCFFSFPQFFIYTLFVFFVFFVFKLFSSKVPNIYNYQFVLVYINKIWNLSSICSILYVIFFSKLIFCSWKKSNDFSQILNKMFGKNFPIYIWNLFLFICIFFW